VHTLADNQIYFIIIAMAKTIDISKYKSLWKTKKALELVKAEDRTEILKYY
jgi:prolyl-tRNA editing enzyme YbaK/EbsC (Cys-tRNA(Pro) deacylase)